MDDFLNRCFYQPGQYKDQEDFSKLAGRMAEFEGVSLSVHSRENTLETTCGLCGGFSFHVQHGDLLGIPR